MRSRHWPRRWPAWTSNREDPPQPRFGERLITVSFFFFFLFLAAPDVKIEILTVTWPRDHEGAAALGASARRAGLAVRNLAAHPWRGFRDKAHALLDWIATSPSSSEYAVLVDGFDVLVHPDGKQRLERLVSWFDARPATQLLVSRDAFCLQNCHPTPQGWVNSGVVAGRARGLAAWAHELLRGPDPDDQRALGRLVAARGAPWAMIDTDSMLATTVTGAWHCVPHGFADYNSVFVHWPGSNWVPIGLASHTRAWSGCRVKQQELGVLRRRVLWACAILALGIMLLA